REHAGDSPLVPPFAKSGDVHRPEDLVRLGEAREQVFEVPRLEQAREHPDERRFRGARRTDQDRVLARDRRDEEEPDHLVFAEETRLEGSPNLGEANRERVVLLGGGHSRERRAYHGWRRGQLGYPRAVIALRDVRKRWPGGGGLEPTSL